MKSIRGLLAGLLACSISLTGLQAISVADLQKRIEKRRQELLRGGANAKDVIRSISAQATPFKAKKRATTDAHARSEKRLQDGKKQYDMIAGKLDELKRELSKMAEDTAKIKEEHDKAEASLKQLGNESVKVLTQKKMDLQKQIDTLNKDLEEIKQQAVMGSEIATATKVKADTQQVLDALGKTMADIDKAILDASMGG